MLLAAATLVAGVVSCQKEVRHETPASVALYTHPGKPVPAAAGTIGVTVSATVDDWTAVSMADWITVELAEGSAYTKGVREVILTYTENTTGKQRSGVVVFSVGAQGETYTLTQEAN